MRSGADGVGVAGRGGALRPAAGVLALLALLAVVAISAGGGRSLRGDESDVTAPQLLVDYVFSILAVLGVALAVLAVVIFWQARFPWKDPNRSYGRTLIGLLLFFLLAAGATRFAHFAEPRPVEEEDTKLARPELQPQPDREGTADPQRNPSFRWEVAIAAGLGAAAVAALLASRRRRPLDEHEPGAAHAVSLVLDEALDDLRAEDDARRAVIAAYARLETTLAYYGLPRRPAEAPLEYLSRVLLAMQVTPGAVLDLTELFEQAKFSRRPIDAAMKHEAIDALAAVRDDLRAAA